MFHKALKVVDTLLQSFSEVATSVPQKGGSKLSTSKEMSTTYEPCLFSNCDFSLSSLFKRGVALAPLPKNVIFYITIHYSKK